MPAKRRSPLWLRRSAAFLVLLLAACGGGGAGGGGGSDGGAPALAGAVRFQVDIPTKAMA
jgi:hypothetical protein